jgi:hypothetical protein
MIKDECRLKVNLQLSTYINLVTTARKQVGVDDALLELQLNLLNLISSITWF